MAQAPEGRVLRLAPREVPRALGWRLLFGGRLGVWNWPMAVVCMTLALALAQCTDLGLADYDRMTSATVTLVDLTNTREDKRPLYRVHYTFVDESGVERHGVSYTPDRPVPYQSLRVDYRSDAPSESRLYGMRRAPLSPFLLILAIAGALQGFALGIWQFLQGRRDLRLLRHGVETRGKLIENREISKPAGELPIMALTFEYEVSGRTYSATVKTQTPELLEDDEREPLLYDPYTPARATTLDHLPGSPKITDSGELAVQLGSATRFLILPLLFFGLLVATVLQVL